MLNEKISPLDALGGSSHVKMAKVDSNKCRGYMQEGSISRKATSPHLVNYVLRNNLWLVHSPSHRWGWK